MVYYTLTQSSNKEFMAVDTKTIFNVVKRDKKTQKPNQVRRENKIPANIMGLAKNSQTVIADRIAFEKLYNNEGDTGLVYLQLDDSKENVPVLIEDVQRDPRTGNVSHAVFKRVNLKVKVKAEVPVEVVGENEVKNAVLVLVKDSIEVEALPANFPESFEIKAELLTEIGQSITLADLDYNRDEVELVLSEEESETDPVAILQEVKEEVEPEVIETEITVGSGEEKSDGAEGDEKSDSNSENKSE